MELLAPSAPRAANADRLGAFPLYVLRLVVSFAADCAGDASQFVPRSPACVRRSMPQLALLSRDWRQVVREMESAHHALTRALSFRAALGASADSAAGILNAVYAELAGNGASLLELKVHVGVRGPVSGGNFVIRQEFKLLQSLDSLEIDWHRIFACCRRLLRLDLSDIPLNSEHIVRILDAASSECLHLQALVLPASSAGIDERGVDPAPVMFGLYQALERWHMRGSRRGLTQLTVPKRHNSSGSNFSLQQRSDQYLTAVSQFCPNIEHLDGWKATYADVGELSCSEIWFCSLDAWRSFCRACGGSLREFNWFVAPFDKDFLETFACSPKPNLKTMTLTCGNDDYYSDFLITGEYHRAGGFYMTDESVARVVSACPALQELAVLFNKRLYRSMWLQERISNSFLRCVADSCPELRTLTIDEVDIVGREQNDPSPRDKRRVVVKVGSTDPAFPVQFFDTLLELIEAMLAQSTRALASHRFTLELLVRGTGEVRDREAVRAKLVTLRGDLAAQHPSIDVLFCALTKKIHLVPKQIEKVRSVLFISQPSELFEA